MDVMLRNVYYFCWEQEFEESEVVNDSGYIYVIREQLGRKRSLDQIATYGSESPVKMSLSSMNGPAQPSPEKLPVVIASHDGLSENISSDLNLVSGWAEKSAEKSDVELSNERPLMNVQQELVAPSNTILFLHNPLQQSLPMGKVSTKQCFLFAFMNNFGLYNYRWQQIVLDSSVKGEWHCYKWLQDC